MSHDSEYTVTLLDVNVYGDSNEIKSILCNAHSILMITKVTNFKSIREPL